MPNQPTRDDRSIRWMQKAIQLALRLLAAIMIVVIFLGVVDVLWVLYQRLVTPPMFILKINDILATFGAFMAVLIAIEIFINITVYLRDEEIHVKVVMATALVAIARKVIVLDFSAISAAEAAAIAGIMLATSVGYWLLTFKQKTRRDQAT